MNLATQTGANGRYFISVSPGTKSLDFTFVSYAPLTANIGNDNVLNVILQPSTRQLSKVIVDAGGLAASGKS